MKKLYKILIVFFLFSGNIEKVIKYRIKLAKLLGVKIGKNLRCFSDPISSEPYLIEIKNNCTISSGVKFVTHDNSIIKIFKDGTDSVGKIIIGNNCFIGINSIILPGVQIGDNTIIGAGSVVTKSFKTGNVIIAGNPAKVVSTIDEYRKKLGDNYFNFRNKTFLEKKNELFNNEIFFIKK